jgi:hypothetical protein
MLWVFPKKSDALGTGSMSGPFSKLKIDSKGHWRIVYLFAMPSKGSNVCTAFNVTVADVTSAKEAES